MQFIIKFASCLTYTEKREIKTIQDLEKLSEENDNEALIIDFDKSGNEPTITVYDDCVE